MPSLVSLLLKAILPHPRLSYRDGLCSDRHRANLPPCKSCLASRIGQGGFLDLNTLQRVDMVS